MMDVLLGFIGIVPFDLGLEVAGLGIEVHRCEVSAHDSFERVNLRAGTQTIQRIGPCRPIAQTDCVVVPIREAESHQEAAGRLSSQRINQLLSQQAHGGRTKDDDALLMQPNDAFIRPKIEELGELQPAIVHLHNIAP